MIAIIELERDGATAADCLMQLSDQVLDALQPVTDSAPAMPALWLAAVCLAPLTLPLLGARIGAQLRPVLADIDANVARFRSALAPSFRAAGAWIAGFLQARLAYAEPRIQGVTALVGFGPHRFDAESELTRKNVILPLPQRAAALRERDCSDTLLLTVRDEAGAPLAAAGIGTFATRALPGHSYHRLARFSATSDEHTDRALLAAVADAAHADARCLGLTVEIFERDTARRQRIADTLRSLGFTRAPHALNYERTLALELAPSTQELFASISAKARRDVRAASKRGLILRPVEDDFFAPRLASLMDETFRRTGAVAPTWSWENIVRRSKDDPTRSRVSALFDPDVRGPESLVAFAWGCVHGGYVTYEAGATTRRRRLGNTPLGYAPLWDLIAWSREIGADWFDFGGITSGTLASHNDPVGGISDFKRYFCKRAIDVSEDWVLVPHPFRAGLARRIGSAARWAIPKRWTTRRPVHIAQPF